MCVCRLNLYYDLKSHLFLVLSHILSRHVEIDFIATSYILSARMEKKRIKSAYASENTNSPTGINSAHPQVS